MKKINTDALNEQYGESSFEAAQDARDVDKAFEEWLRVVPAGKYKSWQQETKAFAKFYAQRCGVVLDGNSEIPNNQECEHPYHSVVGGNGRPERCLKCGKVLSI